jgi:hypothetical protein
MLNQVIKWNAKQNKFYKKKKREKKNKSWNVMIN